MTLLSQNLRTTLENDVKDFHDSFGHPAPTFPITELTPGVIELLERRAEWLIEEANELKEALEERNLIKAIDALGDSIYFGVGGFVTLGLPLGPFWINIQEANMAKLGPDGKPVPHPTLPGKIGKPEGWVPPEARHEETLAAYRKYAQIEGLARQLAYSRLVDPHCEINLNRVPLEGLQRAMVRAEELWSQGENWVRGAYREVQRFEQEYGLGQGVQ